MTNNTSLIPDPPKRGRPTKAVERERQIELILERVSAGETLEAVCKSPGMPNPTEFRRWVRKDPGLRAEWLQARHDYAHSLFDQMADLTKVLSTAKFGRDDSAKVTALRTAIDALKHITARLAPETYAEQKPGNQEMVVNIITSLPLGPGSIPATPVDTEFKVVGRIKSG